MEKRLRGNKPFHDDCLFLIAEKPTSYQLDKCLELCTEVIWDNNVSNDFVVFRVNKIDWDNFTSAALSEGVVFVSKK